MGSGKECKIKEGFFSSILYDSAAGVYADGTNPLERESMIQEKRASCWGGAFAQGMRWIWCAVGGVGKAGPLEKREKWGRLHIKEKFYSDFYIISKVISAPAR